MIRRAHAGEARAVAALVHAAFTPYLPRSGVPPTPLLMDYDEAVAAGVVDVALEEQTVVGMILLRDRPDHLFLDVIAVDPAFGGRGIGGTLLAHAEAEAVRRNHGEIRLFTHATMVEAQAVYLRHGYVEVERATTEGRPRVVYSKPVRAP